MSDNLTQDHVTTETVTDTGEAPEAVEPTSAEVSEPIGYVEEAFEAGNEADDNAGDDAPAAPTQSNRRANLEREGEVAADFLETLLDICDLDGDIDVDIEGDRAAVSVVDSEDGRVPRRLVGPNGQVLEALQELTRLAVQSATGERSRLMLDVAGHRAERRAALVTLAKEAIDEVRSTGERKPLTPMTAFERKVVHDEVLAAGLVSESEGAEPRRFVVILPA
jgi:spoIIIJ-associated protein